MNIVRFSIFPILTQWHARLPIYPRMEILSVLTTDFIESTFNSTYSVGNKEDFSMLPFLDGVSTTDEPTLLITVLVIILLLTLAVSKVGQKRDQDPPLARGGTLKAVEMIS
jgi:hypothetical protein